MELTLSQITMMGCSIAPRNTIFCQGQLVSISQHSSLYSLLATTYGGDGRTNFGIPDLRGRSPLGQGQGLGLTPRYLGERLGVEVDTTPLPAHTHTLDGLSASLHAKKGTGDANDANGNYIATGEPFSTGRSPTSLGTVNNSFSTTTNAVMNANAVSLAGTISAAGVPNAMQNNMQPSIGMNYVIAIEGTYPTRN
ncbi:MAG: tail fiber protein [Mariprofundaceae bacterium]|nr:tail fiber protein [Mariprofundaceae bacterium]